MAPSHRGRACVAPERRSVRSLPRTLVATGLSAAPHPHCPPGRTPRQVKACPLPLQPALLVEGARCCRGLRRATRQQPSRPGPGQPRRQTSASILSPPEEPGRAHGLGDLHPVVSSRRGVVLARGRPLGRLLGRLSIRRVYSAPSSEISSQAFRCWITTLRFRACYFPPRAATAEVQGIAELRVVPARPRVARIARGTCRPRDSTPPVRPPRTRGPRAGPVGSRTQVEHCGKCGGARRQRRPEASRAKVSGALSRSTRGWLVSSEWVSSE